VTRYNNNNNNNNNNNVPLWCHWGADRKGSTRANSKTCANVVPAHAIKVEEEGEAYFYSFFSSVLDKVKGRLHAPVSP
jgi:hypothetical protein